MTDLPAEDTTSHEVEDLEAPETSAEEAEVSGDHLDEARREELLADTPEEAAARAPGVVETGNEAVDAVIRGLEGLDGVPVDDHVAIFEQAHEDLRRTLSGAGDDRS